MYYPCDTALVEPTLNRCMNSARQYDRVALECFLARPTDIRHYPRLAVLSTYLIDLWRFVLELDGRPVQSSPVHARGIMVHCMTSTVAQFVLHVHVITGCMLCICGACNVTQCCLQCVVVRRSVNSSVST